ncbi:MAG: radical SAM protein [Candidatus Omnitrophota bacterium]|jgi:radical SAM superfamily enzyme YgiQ (UPF0313 family)|nr:MAG: radical SAM protein [Candidatus Omnitrophota bacterium]
MNALLISLQDNLEIGGLKYLHYNLLENNHNSYLLFSPGFVPGPKKAPGLKKFITGVDPAFIGISLMSHEFKKAAELTEYLKKEISGVPIIWGGVHPTIYPESCLKYADYVCIGEGDNVILDIAEAVEGRKNIRGLNNLAYVDRGAIKRNLLSPIITDLDRLPEVDRVFKNSFVLTEKGIQGFSKKHLQIYTRYSGRMYNIMTTRGCPFSCTYCCNNFFSQLYHTKIVRRRSADNIISELERNVCRNPEIEYVNFHDDCFIECSEDYLKDFCAKYKKAIGRPFIIRAIPAYINENKIGVLKDSGLAWINMGLQSGSDDILRDVYKRRSLKSDFIAATNIIKKYGIAAIYDVILDNPYEREEDSFETMRIISSTPKPFHLESYSLVTYYGTELYKRAKLDYPEFADKFFDKDFHSFKKKQINKLIKLASIFSPSIMNRLIEMYKIKKNNFRFKVLLSLIYVFGMLVILPVNYIKLIKLSQGKSYIRSLNHLSVFIKIGISRLVNNFRIA